MAIPMEIVQGKNNLDKIILRGEGLSSAEIYLYGGQVTSWKNEHGEELLFVSNKANFKPFTPIRGGIPICFPQFLDMGPLQQHGFARNSFWRVVPENPAIPYDGANRASVELILMTREVDLKEWPNRLRVTLSPRGELTLTSCIKNTRTAGKPLSFTFAYNTYVSVSNIRKIQVEGLETLHYLDNIRNREQFTEDVFPLSFESEVDRLYLGTPSKITIQDYKGKRTTAIRRKGIPDAIVWNPWDKKAKAMADLGKKNYNLMLCLGAAVAENPVTLKPGEEWTGIMELTSVNTCGKRGSVEPRKGSPKGTKERKGSSKFTYTWFR